MPANQKSKKYYKKKYKKKYQNESNNSKFTCKLKEKNWKAVIANPTTQFNQQWNITLYDVSNFSDFAKIWSQYKINKVKLTFRPVGPEIASINVQDTDTGTTLIPRCCVVIDRTSFAPSGSVNPFEDVGNKPRSRTRPMTKPMVMYWKPNTVAPIYQTLTNNAYTAEYDQYIGTEYPKAMHKGIQVTAETGNSLFRYEVDLTLYVTFKSRTNTA